MNYGSLVKQFLCMSCAARPSCRGVHTPGDQTERLWLALMRK